MSGMASHIRRRARWPIIGGAVRHSTGPLEQPALWLVGPGGKSVKVYKNGRRVGIKPRGEAWRPLSIAFPQEPPRWRIRSTKIMPLLTQNLNGKGRPASTFLWWGQPDEGHYLREYKNGLAEYLAETEENYYVVEETSRYRPRFVCPDSSKRGVFGGDILIYVNPANGQVSWICPKCTYFNSKERGGDGAAVKHVIPEELRKELAGDDIIPKKDIDIEIEDLYRTICKNPGLSFYELDGAMGWSRGRTERIVNKHLKNRVLLALSRGRQKGYKVYPKN